MREIKFKAWDKYEEQMFYGVEEGIYEDPDGMIDFDTVLGLARFEVMQFTGLTDKNGKEIYEGDIVEFDGKRHSITFANGGFGIWEEVRTSLYSNETRQYHEPLWNLVVDGCEVIGSIYENPELLEQHHD